MLNKKDDLPVLKEIDRFIKRLMRFMDVEPFDWDYTKDISDEVLYRLDNINWNNDLPF